MFYDFSAIINQNSLLPALLTSMAGVCLYYARTMGVLSMMAIIVLRKKTITRDWYGKDNHL